jgi:hypothetical protein
LDVAAQRNLYVLLLLAGISPLLINGVINPLIVGYPWAYWSFEVVTWVLLPVFVFGVAFQYGGLRFEQLGIHARIRERRSVGLLVFMCFLAGPLDYSIYAFSLDFFRSVIPGEAIFDYSPSSRNLERSES